MKPAYKVVFGELYTQIEKCELTDLEGKSWREAKKDLRQYYLNKAASLRKISEKEYFS